MSDETFDKPKALAAITNVTLAFLAQLQPLVPNSEREIIGCRLAVTGGAVSKEKIMEEFSKYILPHVDKIKLRDETFFLTAEHFEKITMFKNTMAEIRSRWLADDFRKNHASMWKWMDTFMKIVVTYNNDV